MSAVVIIESQITLELSVLWPAIHQNASVGPLSTIGPNRHINSQADSIHLLPELLQGENDNPGPSIMAGFDVGGWLDWLRPIG